MSKIKVILDENEIQEALTRFAMKKLNITSTVKADPVELDFNRMEARVTFERVKK